MKKRLTIAICFAIFVLAACQSATPAPTPTPPLSEEWQVRVEKIEEYVDPKGLVCSDCSQLASQDALHPADGYTFLVVVANVLNKTNYGIQATAFSFGITTSGGLDDCEHPNTVANFCLLDGLKLGGKLYVAIGEGLMDFATSFKIAPNSPDGELVEFYFITKTGAKATEFHFIDLPPINISGLNP